MTTYPSPTVKIRKEQPKAPIGQPPPLNSGDSLTRAEFERRYQAHPEIKKAELIEGVVYVAYPIHFKQHSVPHFDAITWLGAYRANTPFVLGGDAASLRLDFENELQPDILLRLDPKVGGKCQETEDDYLEGSPELVVEIAASSVAYDLNVKKRAYARNGVPEYLAIQIYEQKIDWFVLREGVYQNLTADEQGAIRSEVFPGLWLDTAAFWASDIEKVIKVLQEGIDSVEHKAFVNQLQDRK